MNKKGMEQQQAIVYMIFVSVFLVFSIVIINSYMTNIDVNLRFRIFNLEYNTLAARLVYSPDCFVYEELSPCSGDRYKVHPGVLDMSKFADQETGDKTLRNCMHFDKSNYYFIRIEDTDNDEVLYEKKSEGDCLGRGRTENFPVVIKESDAEVNGRLTFCLINVEQI